MKTPMIRLATVLLIPCLVVNPVFAGGMEFTRFRPRTPIPDFAAQAMSPAAAAFTRPAISRRAFMIGLGAVAAASALPRLSAQETPGDDLSDPWVEDVIQQVKEFIAKTAVKWDRSQNPLEKSWAPYAFDATMHLFDIDTNDPLPLRTTNTRENDGTYLRTHDETSKRFEYYLGANPAIWKDYFRLLKTGSPAERRWAQLTMEEWLANEFGGIQFLDEHRYLGASLRILDKRYGKFLKRYDSPEPISEDDTELIKLYTAISLAKPTEGDVAMVRHMKSRRIKPQALVAPPSAAGSVAAVHSILFDATLWQGLLKASNEEQYRRLAIRHMTGVARAPIIFNAGENRTQLFRSALKVEGQERHVVKDAAFLAYATDDRYRLATPSQIRAMLSIPGDAVAAAPAPAAEKPTSTFFGWAGAGLVLGILAAWKLRFHRKPKDEDGENLLNRQALAAPALSAQRNILQIPVNAAAYPQFLTPNRKISHNGLGEGNVVRRFGSFVYSRFPVRLNGRAKAGAFFQERFSIFDTTLRVFLTSSELESLVGPRVELDSLPDKPEAFDWRSVNHPSRRLPNTRPEAVQYFQDRMDYVADPSVMESWRPVSYEFTRKIQAGKVSRIRDWAHLVNVLIRQGVIPKRAEDEIHPKLKSLSAQQRQAVTALADGYLTDEDLGKRLNVAPLTASKFIYLARQKINIHGSRGPFLIEMMRRGWLMPANAVVRIVEEFVEHVKTVERRALEDAVAGIQSAAIGHRIKDINAGLRRASERHNRTPPVTFYLAAAVLAAPKKIIRVAA